MDNPLIPFSKILKKRFEKSLEKIRNKVVDLNDYKKEKKEKEKEKNK